MGQSTVLMTPPHAEREEEAPLRDDCYWGCY